MKILFVIQWFQPEPALKGLPFAKTLIEMGHEVQVLTGFPNYPGGKLYEGYKVRFFQKEVIEGVSVLRVPLYPSHDKSPLCRIINYLSYAISASLIGPWVVNKADIAYVYHPPPTTYIPANVIKLFRGIPVVYDIQDFWPDSLAASGMFNNRFGLWIVDQYCKLAYKFANKIVVLSPGFKKKLIDKGIAENKIQVIYNWCDETQLKADETDHNLQKQLGMDGKFNVVFAGNMGKVQALETVLKGAEIIASKHPDIQFVMVGGGVDVDNLKHKTKELGLSNVIFIPRMPTSKIGKVLALANVLLVHLKDDPLFRITIPSKIQAYMAAGKPILVAVSGDAADLVEMAKAGISCKSECPEAIAHAVEVLYEMSQDMLRQMGENGKHFYYNNLSLDAGASHFEEIFKSIVK